MRLEGKKLGRVCSKLPAATEDRRALEQVASERTTLMTAERGDCTLLGQATVSPQAASLFLRGDFHCRVIITCKRT